MPSKCKFKYTGAIVLGMHDSLVEISGILAGLVFAVAQGRIIVLTGIIAAAAASLSMAAANYMAQRTDANPDALRCAVYTGLAYLGTSALIVMPFCIIANRFRALGVMAAIAVAIILGFNLFTRCDDARPYWRRTREMLGVCTAVTFLSFAIGAAAKHFLGVTI